jgi:hypothetical protein
MAESPRFVNQFMTRVEWLSCHRCEEVEAITAPRARQPQHLTVAARREVRRSTHICSRHHFGFALNQTTPEFRRFSRRVNQITR